MAVNLHDTSAEDAEPNRLQDMIVSLQQKFAELRQEFTELRQNFAEQQQRLDRQEQKIKDQDQQILVLQEENASLRQTVKDQDQQILSLTRRVDDLENDRLVRFSPDRLPSHISVSVILTHSNKFLL